MRTKILSPRRIHSSLLAGVVLGFMTLAIPAVSALAQSEADAEAAPTTETAPPPSRIEIRQTTIDEPRLVREGAFLSDMRGELRRTQIGWVIDFAPDAKTGKRLVSMVLQSGMTLTAMEQIITAHDEPIGFIVSGQVFVYHNRNYLLPTRFAITTEVEPPRTIADSEADPATPAEDSFGLPGFDEGAGEPSIGDLLEGVRSGASGNPDQPMPPAATGAAALREGRMIAQIRGRILPAGGELIFTQDTDTDTADPDGELPPMRLMPCLNVERLETLRREWGDRLIVSMSGRIFVEDGHPILLPTMYVVELDRAGNLTLGQ